MSIRLLLLLVGTIGLPGCSTRGDLPEIGTVSGMVTEQGQPAAGVQVSFMPTTGRPSYGTTGADGRFTLLYAEGVFGAVLGNHKVLLQAPPAATGTDAAPATVTPIEWSEVVEVKAGKNDFQFDLKNTSRKSK